jgi:hypothetical protein
MMKHAHRSRSLTVRPSDLLDARAVTMVGCAMLAAAVIGAALPRVSRAEEPAPQPSGTKSGAAVPHLPVIDAQGPTTRVEGKIVRSSCGHKGPVRLLVERKGGDQVTVLVGPEDLCTRLGVPLQDGDTVDVEGAMVKSDHPILIAAAFKTADGKTIRVRDASGQLIGADTARGGAAGGKPTVSGPKPAAPSPPQK